MESIFCEHEPRAAYFEAAPTRALWKEIAATHSAGSRISKQPPQGHYGKSNGPRTRPFTPISKQPPQGHYGKGAAESAGVTYTFRSSPHKGIMERGCKTIMRDMTYFEAAPTRALWKDGRRHERKSEKISKQPPQGHYGKEKKSKCLSKCQFRSSPHKGIMERVRMTFILSVKYFEAAPTRALWKALLTS